jgi:alanine dehydrogenase
MKTKLLSRSDIESFLTMSTCMTAVEKAFSDLASGNANMPQRTPIGLPDKQGVALFMPAHIKSLGALGAKVVTVYKNNPTKHSLPAVLGTIILLDEETGFPVAIMDGGFITAMRTGAVSGVATKYMARPDASVGMIFGTGVQAFTQVLAVHQARPLKKLLAYSVDPPDKQVDFATRVSKALDVEVEQVKNVAEAVGRADIITLATSASEPIIDGNWMKLGTHINGIGSHAPTMRELDTFTVLNSRIVCDLTSACQAEAGDFMIPANEGVWSWDAVAGSLGDVILGKVKGRTSNDEITLFKSVGLAIQDLSVARAVYDEAVKAGVGSEFSF